MRRGLLDLLEAEQRAADDRVFVTVGRAAQMLRVTRWVVHKYVRAGQLCSETIEGTRHAQLMFRKSDVRALLLARADRRLRRPPTYGPQRSLPLRTVTAPPERPPMSWRWATFKPVTIRAGLRKATTKVDDRLPRAAETSKQSRRFA